MKQKIFKITNWYVQINHIAKMYLEIKSLLTNPAVIDQHLDKKIDKINAIEPAEIHWNAENVGEFKEMHGHTFNRALELYERQVIVNISTLTMLN